MKSATKLLGKFVLILFGLMLSLLLLEGAVRLFGLAPPAELLPPLWEPHPYMGWYHVPNQGGVSYSEYGEYRAPVHINARGLRDREIGYENPDADYRILVLGDSFAESLQVSLEETFAKQLEGRLSSDDRVVELINSGVGSWGTDQEATFYVVEGFRYQPDLILLFFFPHNDVMNNYQPLELARTQGVVRKPFFRLEEGELIVPEFPFEAPPSGQDEDQVSAPLLPLGNWLNQRAALYRLASPQLRNIPFVLRGLGPSGVLGGMAVFMATESDTSLSYHVYRADLPPEWEEAWQLTAALIQRLDSEAKDRGSRLAVVVIGAPEQVYPERWEAVLDRNPQMSQYAWELEGPNRHMAEILEESSIPYLDLLPLFRTAAAEEGAPSLHFVHDGHWTPAGHTLVTEAVASFLEEQGLDDQQ